mgnify:FL=1
MDRGEHQMSEWINCGLPWNIDIMDWEKFRAFVADLQPEIDRLSHLQVGALENKRAANSEKIKEDVGVDDIGCIKDWDAVAAHPLHVENKILTQEINKKLDEMWKSEAVCLEYSQRENDYRKGRALLSFCGLSLNKPGVLVEVNNKQYLLGHINHLNVDAGCCGSSAFEDKDIVTRYKVIWSSNE